jgi:hypothetical protein
MTEELRKGIEDWRVESVKFLLSTEFSALDMESKTEIRDRIKDLNAAFMKIEDHFATVENNAELKSSNP